MITGALILFVVMLSFANGSNDVSKGIATLVGSGITNYRKAGVLYQVIEATPTTDPNKLLWDHVEQTVTVKGKIFEKDGMHVIVPEEVKGS